MHPPMFDHIPLLAVLAEHIRFPIARCASGTSVRSAERTGRKIRDFCSGYFDDEWIVMNKASLASILLPYRLFGRRTEAPCAELL